MNICMLVKNSFEYDARVAREAGALQEAGHQVTVVGIHVDGVTAARETLPNGVKVVRVAQPGTVVRRRVATGGPSTATPGAAATVADTPTVNRGRMLALAAAVFRAWSSRRLDGLFVREALAQRPDVIHCHDLNTLRAGIAVAAMTRAAVVYDAHELHAHRSRATKTEQRKAFRREARLIKHADAVITSSPGYADWLRDHYQVRATIVRNVPEAPQRTDAIDLRAQLGIGPDDRIALYQGSLQENRGVEQLIAATGIVEQLVAVIVGYGHHRPALQAFADRRGVSDRVWFVGPVANDELIAWTRGADVGMCNIVGTSLSYRESLPNKLFEYAAAGIPIVVSDYPTMGGLVTEYDAGERCAPDDQDSVAEAIKRLVDDRTRMKSCRAGARRLTESITWPIEARALLDAYRAITSDA